VDVVRAQLADLIQVQEAAALYGTPDFASRLGWETLWSQDQALRAELRAAELLESKFDGEFVVDGDAVTVDHGIEFTFLGKLLEEAQAVFHSLAAALTGSTSRQASLPNHIISRNTLRFFTCYPSSFAVRFRVDAPAAEEMLIELPPSGVLDSFTAILDGEADSETLLTVANHGRLKSHYQALNELLAKANSNLSVRTRARPFGSRMTAPQARHRVTWLETIEVKEQETTLIGRLVGGSVEYDRFELAVGGEVLTGRLASSARAELQVLHFGEEVQARLKEFTSTATTGAQASRKYLLLGVIPAKGEGQLFKPLTVT
jgi:hypothetical protein